MHNPSISWMFKNTHKLCKIGDNLFIGFNYEPRLWFWGGGGAEDSDGEKNSCEESPGKSSALGHRGVLQLFLTKHRALQNSRSSETSCVWGPHQGKCFSLGGFWPLVPQSMDETGVPWPGCAGGTGSFIAAYSKHMVKSRFVMQSTSCPWWAILPWLTPRTAEYGCGRCSWPWREGLHGLGGCCMLCLWCKPNPQSLPVELDRKIPSLSPEFITMFTTSLWAIYLLLPPFQCMLLLSSWQPGTAPTSTACGALCAESQS